MSDSFGAFEAKTHLAALLDRVERGEELTITRRCQPVARLVPIAPQGVPLSETLRTHRKELREAGFKPLSLDEIREMRDAGRKY